MEEEEEPTFFDSILDGVYEALEKFWCWLVNWSMDWLDWMLELLDPLLPDIGGYWDVIGPAVGYGNHWLPLSEAIAFGTGLLILKITLIAIRWIVAFMPTIG